MSRNGYTYAEGNPVNFTDPSGEVIPLVGALIGGTIGGFGAGSMAAQFYDMAKSCQCGKTWKNWADRTNKWKFIATAAATGGLVGAGLGALATVQPQAAVTLAAGLSFGNLLGSTLRQSSGSSGLNPCDGLIASQSAQSAASSAGGSGGSGPTLAGGGGVGVLALPVAGTAAGRLAAIPGASWTTGIEIALHLPFLYSSSGEDGNNGDEDNTNEPRRTPGGRIITEHAEKSLVRHGFQEPYSDVDNIIDRPSRIAIQDSDEARVYIQRVRGRQIRYNIAIVNEHDPDGSVIITAIRNLTSSDLEGLGRRHGFNPNP